LPITYPSNENRCHHISQIPDEDRKPYDNKNLNLPCGTDEANKNFFKHSYCRPKPHPSACEKAQPPSEKYDHEFALKMQEIEDENMKFEDKINSTWIPLPNIYKDKTRKPDLP
jgi:hypothetical protein